MTAQVALTDFLDKLGELVKPLDGVIYVEPVEKMTNYLGTKTSRIVVHIVDEEDRVQKVFIQGTWE